MSRKKTGPLPGGKLERALLVALWDHEDSDCTARQLHDEVGKSRSIGYTTIAKVLDRMIDKGLVRRRREGRAYRYRARVGREKTQRSIVGQMFSSVLGRNPRPAAAALIGALEDVSPELLDELRRELRARRKDKSNGT